MILKVFKCDHEDCDEETEPLPERAIPPFIAVVEPCPVHGSHLYHFCSLDCALHGLAGHLDHEEELEGAREED